MNDTLAVWTLLRTIMKLLYHNCSISKNRIFHARYIMRRTMQAIRGMECRHSLRHTVLVSCSITKKWHCYMLLYWVLCNLLASFGEVVPYMLVLLKIDNLDVNNNHLYLYYLIKLCKIPLVCCWWTFLGFGYSEFSTRLRTSHPTAPQYLQPWFLRS